MPVAYDRDVIAWADEQARLLRSRRFEELDLEHLADEIEDVGRGERRELASRMAVLLTHLIKWRFQPNFRTRSWELTVRDQRRTIEIALSRTPSLRPMLSDAEWCGGMWLDGVAAAVRETGLDRAAFPDACPWPMHRILDPDWLPH